MQGEVEVIYNSLHIDCSQVCLPDPRLFYFFFYFNFTVTLTIVLFIAVLEKQKVFVPPLLLQKNKCNNKLAKNQPASCLVDCRC